MPVDFAPVFSKYAILKDEVGELCIVVYCNISNVVAVNNFEAVCGSNDVGSGGVLGNGNYPATGSLLLGS